MTADAPAKAPCMTFPAALTAMRKSAVPGKIFLSGKCPLNQPAEAGTRNDAVQAPSEICPPLKSGSHIAVAPSEHIAHELHRIQRAGEAALNGE